MWSPRDTPKLGEHLQDVLVVMCANPVSACRGVSGLLA
eukprot:COSAG02_NODE_58913_length_276_cov_0.553672_1_plen_37_part_01